MKTRTVRYQDGRCEVIRVISTDALEGWSDSDPISYEASIVWLTDVSQLDYVRVMVVKNCKSRRGKLVPNAGDGRVLGYSKLTPDAPADPVTGKFTRRVFYLRAADAERKKQGKPSPRGVVDPKSLLPGVTTVKPSEAEQARVPNRFVVAASLSAKPDARDSMDDEVMDWLAGSIAPSLSAKRPSDSSQALIDTDLAHDVPGSPGKTSKFDNRPQQSFYGELIPLDGTKRIALKKEQVHIGRMAECEIVLQMSNVSGLHCQLAFTGGYWYARDLNSSNGTKVNGKRLIGEESKRLEPGDKLSVAKCEFQIDYQPQRLGAR